MRWKKWSLSLVAGALLTGIAAGQIGSVNQARCKAMKAKIRIPSLPAAPR